MVIIGGIEFELTLQPVMDFHNSAIYNGKAIHLETDEEKNSPRSQGEDGFSLSSSSMKKLTGTSGNVNSWANEYNKEESIAPGGGGSVCFGQPVVGFKLHMPKESANKSSTRNSVPSNTAKRNRVAHQNSQTSRCQVEGCNIDLTTAKDYHRRHRICECHSKSPKVIVAGMERRFCQQCSRFHNLSEFDDKKRSCRRRLSDHNARRRRPHPEAMHLSSVGLESSLYDRRPPSFLLNRLASSFSSTTWDDSCSLKMAQTGSTLIRTSGNASAANSYMNEAPNLPRALSLLSPTATGWGLHQPESIPLDQFMQGTASIAQPVIPLESHEWPLTSALHVSAEQPPSISPLQ